MNEVQEELKSAFTNIRPPEGLKESTLSYINKMRSESAPLELKSFDGEALSEQSLNTQSQDGQSLDTQSQDGQSLDAQSQDEQSLDAQSQKVKKKRKFKVWYPTIAAVAAVVVVAFLCVGIFLPSFSGSSAVNASKVETFKKIDSSSEAQSSIIQDMTPAAFVGIDVNPSIEFELNAQEDVLDIVSLNDDAKPIIDALDVVGKPYQEALISLAENQQFIDYLANDATVEVQVASDNSELAAALTEFTNQELSNFGYHPTCTQTDLAHHEQAHNAGMGMARYSAASELSQLDPSVSIEDCAKMSMREIRDAISSHHAAQAQAQQSAGQAAEQQSQQHAQQSQSQPQAQPQQQQQQQQQQRHDYNKQYSGHSNKQEHGSSGHE